MLVASQGGKMPIASRVMTWEFELTGAIAVLLVLGGIFHVATCAERGWFTYFHLAFLAALALYMVILIGLNPFRLSTSLGSLFFQILYLVPVVVAFVIYCRYRIFLAAVGAAWFVLESLAMLTSIS